MKDCFIYVEDNKLLQMFYYESDHLGSASYVTNSDGKVTQTLNYLPYGEDWVDLQNFSEMPAESNLGVYKFNGKEKDAESGYNYYGARYYDSEKLSWLSVDPMSDKYPSLSPYVYCANNPVKLIDPNGEFPIFPLIYYLTARHLEYKGKNHISREIGYAMRHPINAYKVGNYNSGSNNISTIASNFQVNVAIAAKLSSGNEGDQGNAFRHVLWQAMITNEIGCNQAKRIGNVHEDNNINLDQRVFKSLSEADRVVDLLNNVIGRELGVENKGMSNNSMAKKVAKEFYENGLWTVLKNRNGNFTIQKIKITKDQYNAAIKTINKKGNNGLNQ